VSKRWRIAGLLIAGTTFVVSLTSAGAHELPLYGPAPAVAVAAFFAVAAFVWVWLAEGVAHALMALRRLVRHDDST